MIIGSSKKMSSKNKIILFTSLSYMQSAGMTLREGLDILLQNTDNKLNSKVLDLMKDEIDEGLRLSQILQGHEDIFGSGLWRQVDAAERSGKVPECLLRITEQFKSSSSINSKIKGALAYPIVVLVVALVASYYLFTTTIPEMGEMMREFGASLPPVTELMMKICDGLVTYGALIGVIILLIVLLIIWAIKKPLRMKWHRLITRFPLSKSISINFNYSLVYLLLNDMTENGAHAVEALRIAASSAPNIFIAGELIKCADMMEVEGYGLARVLQSANTMPSDDRLMLDVGSRTGRESEVLKDLVSRRNAYANDSVSNLLALLTPIIMVGVCVLVGLLVVSVYMPMLTMASSMR